MRDSLQKIRVFVVSVFVLSCEASGTSGASMTMPTLDAPRPAASASAPSTSQAALALPTPTAPTSASAPAAPTKKIKEVASFTEHDGRFCADMDGNMSDCPARSFAEKDCEQHIAKKYKGMKCSFVLGPARGSTPMRQDCAITCE